ncbi:ATP-binding protein [Holzapfeliella sp. JNUCC 72]
MENIDFLKPETDQVRQSIKGIDDSYNNPWDILAELSQNSVDAIREQYSQKKSKDYTGKIMIKIDCSHKSITMKDNGIGIPKDSVPLLLRPFSTNKTDKKNLVGEKGVGLTFVIFTSNNFSIETSYEKTKFRGEVEGAYDWKKNRTQDLPVIKHIPDNDFSVENGTTIKIDNIKNSDIFNLSYDQLKYVLRSKTALGSTKALFGSDIPIEITLKYIDLENNQYSDILPFKYQTIDEITDDDSKIDYKTFESKASRLDRTDADKTNLLKNKLIYDKGEFSYKNNRHLKYKAVYVPSRSVWESKSIKYNLATEDQINDPDWESQYGFSIFERGIYLSVKGMPTGISINPPTTGIQGYWGNLFILIEDDQLSFDIGRKSIHNMQANIYKQKAKEIFQKITNLVLKFTSGQGYLDEDSKWKKEETFNEIEKIQDLSSPNTSFIKEPHGQEATVAGMFYDMLGRNIITNIKPMSSGYKGKYDLYAKSNNYKVVMEFKASITSILKDFNDNRKIFSELDCIVCWDVTNSDMKKFETEHIELEEYHPSEFEKNRSIFDQATHKLVGFQQSIYIIDIKKLLY